MWSVGLLYEHLGRLAATGDGLHCSREILLCPSLLRARSTAASAFSKLLTPFSAGHHLVRAVRVVLELAL